MLGFVRTPTFLESTSRLLLLLFLPRSFARTLVLCGSRFLHGPSSMRPLLGPLHDRTRSQGRERDRGSSVGSRLATTKPRNSRPSITLLSVVVASPTPPTHGSVKIYADGSRSLGVLG